MFRSERHVFSVLSVVLGLALAAPSVVAQSGVVGWGEQVFNSAWNEEPFVEVAAGEGHTVARRSDGSVAAFGWNDGGQCSVPALPAGLTYVEVAAGDIHTVARCSDGSVVAWGWNNYGQCDVPALPAGLTWIEVAAGQAHTVARRSDGSVVAWGWNYFGQCSVPELPAGLTWVEVAAGRFHTVARSPPPLLGLNSASASPGARVNRC